MLRKKPGLFRGRAVQGGVDEQESINYRHSRF